MKKTVKAWAIIDRKGALLEIQFSKKIAQIWLDKKNGEMIVPCTVTFTLPKKAKKK